MEINDDTEIDENIKNLMEQYNKQVAALESMQKNLKEMNKIIIKILTTTMMSLIRMEDFIPRDNIQVIKPTTKIATKLT